MIFKRKMMFLILSLVLVSVLIVGCSSSDSDTPPASNEGEPTSETEAVGLTEAFAEGPTILTSIGQSADVEMIKALMDNAGINYTMDKLVMADGLGDAKTLILAVGGSSKGLGAAGIDADDEISRTTDLINAAKANDVKIIAMHIGGENRRGELSDKFITPSLENADYIIAVKEGNNDGLFTKIASEKSIPIDLVSSISDAIEPLKGAYK